MSTTTVQLRVAVGAAAATVVGITGRAADRWFGTPLLAIGLAAMLAVAALVVAGVVRGRRAPSFLLVAALGTSVAAVGVSRVIIRQYVERAVVGGTVRYEGPLLPPLLWTTLTSVAVAVAGAVVLGGGALYLVGVEHRLLTRRTVAIAVVGTAFAWRVVALLRIAPARTDGGDPLYYHTQANTLARGLGFIEPLNWISRGARIPTAVHGPGYTVYLSLFSRFGASTWFDHRMASSLIGAITVGVAMLITRRIAGTTAALIAGVLTTFYPNMWTIDGVMFPEGLFILLCGLGILFAYRWVDHHRTSDALLLGLTIGGAALTRGEGIFLLALLCAPLVWFARTLGRRTRLAQYGWMVLGASLLLAPWMVRNLVTFDSFVPLSTNGNELHVYSNCDASYHGTFLGYWFYPCQSIIRDPNDDGVIDFEPAGDEAQKAKYWQQVGFDYAKEHLDRLPIVLLARVGRQWELFRPLQNASFAWIEGRSPTWARIALGWYYGLVAAAAFGVRALRRRKVVLLPLAAQFVAVTITALYAYGTIRFRAPAELALCILAAVGIAPLARRVLGWLRAPIGGDPAPEAPAPEAPAPDTASSAWRTRLMRWSPFALVAAVVVAPIRGLFLAPGAPMEEGFMLVFPERVLKGDIANVDFLHLYGPGSLHLLAGVYRLFGTTIGVERSVGLLYDLAIISALMMLARPWGRVTTVIAGITGVLVVFTPIGLSALAWHGAIALALWSLVVVVRGGRHATWLGALLAGLALTFRPDLVVALAVAHVVRWWLAGRSLRHWRVAVAAFVVGLVPNIVHLVQAGPSAFWRGVVVEPVFTLRGGRTLPRPPSLDHLDGALQVIAEKPPPWWPLPSISAPHQLFLWFFVLPLGSIAALVVAVRWWRRARTADTARLVVLATFSVGLLTQALQRPDSTHLLWGSVVLFPLTACWCAQWWSQRVAARSALPRPGTRGGRLALLGAPLVALVLVLPNYTARTYTMHVRQTLGPTHGGLHAGLPVERNGRVFRLGAVRAWLASQAAVDELSQLSKPGERLLVGPVDLRQTAYSDVFFYHLFPELVPATRYIEMDPGIANTADGGLADEVASADWLILTRMWSEWIEPNDSIVFGPDTPNVVVEQQFCLIGSYQHDLVRLYHRCPGGGAPGPYEGPYEPEYDYAVEVAVPIPPRSDGTYPPGSPAAP